MPKVTVRPTKQQPNYKRIAVTGAGGNAAAAVSDQNDATYVRRASSDGAPIARFGLAAPAVPAGCDIATVVPGARLRQPTSNPPKVVTLAMSIPGKKKPKNKLLPTVNGPSVRAGSGTAAYTFAQAAGAGKMTGPTGPWSGVLGQLGIRVSDGHKHTDANRAYVYDLFADLYCAARPTVALSTDPASPITTTSYPELTATFSAVVESWQDNSGPPARTEIAYEVKAFASTVYTAPGFNPETSSPAWSTQGLTAALDYLDGATPSSEAVSDVPDVPLPNGTYRLYARGRRYFDAAQFGAWAYLAFTVGVTPCPAPTIAASIDDAAQRVNVTVTPLSAAGAASPLVTIQRSEDGGATWETVRGGAKAAGVFAAPMLVYDYEAARATALRYRASTEASFVDVQLVSDWGAAVAAGVLTDADWNLKCPLDPSLGWIGANVNADPEWTQEENAATFRPMGRRYPVVVSMSLGGADGSMTLSARTDAEWAKLEGLREYAGTLLLESPHGWARYIRILSRSWTETGGKGAARRKLACSFLEVDAP